MSLLQLIDYAGFDITVVGRFPANEKPPQSTNGTDCRIEACTVYIDQLIRKFGTPPPECSFFVLQTNTSKGVSYEAAMLYLRDDTSAEQYASLIAIGDLYWDDIAKKHLLQIIPSLKVSQ